MMKSITFALKEGGVITVTKLPRQSDDDFYTPLELTILEPSGGTVAAINLSNAEFTNLTSHFRIMRGDSCC